MQGRDPHVHSTPANHSRAWRFRQCPRCRAVLPAGELIQLAMGAQWNQRGTSRCKCPRCGYHAARSLFRVVREARKGGAA
jgi:hypothetical protein